MQILGPPVSIFKSFSQSLEQFFLTVVQNNFVFFSALATTNGKSSSSGGGAKSKSNGQAANNNKQYDFTKSLRNDANLVPPIRQTASIFKQPVTVSSTTYNLNNTAATSMISKSNLISYFMEYN